MAKTPKNEICIAFEAKLAQIFTRGFCESMQFIPEGYTQAECEVTMATMAFHVRQRTMCDAISVITPLELTIIPPPPPYATIEDVELWTLNEDGTRNTRLYPVPEGIDNDADDIVAKG
jgi:hypothetical protein